MPKKKIGPMDIYKLLPGTNCGKCEPKVCMGFAVKLSERAIPLEDCPEIFEDKYKENLKKLKELLKPPVKEITIGSGDHKINIGGQMVVRRHELRYYNPAPITIIVDDEMSEEEISKKVKETVDFKHFYIGKYLTLDMLGIRSTSRDPAKFENAVKKVAEATDWPLVLWSFDPEVLERGLQVIKERRPLLYAATKDNWKDMAEIALKYKCPLAIYSPNDLKMLRSLSNTLIAYGLEDLALDPGAGFGEKVRDVIKNLTILRNAAIKDEDELLGFPLIGSAINVWEDGEGKKPEVKMWEETCLASMMITRYVDLLMLKSSEFWTLLPHVVMREEIYTDPRKPVTVEPGLKTIPIGDKKPDENSPVMITSNWALTYFLVKSDIEASKVPSYLLLVDTEGIGVQSAIPGRKMTAEKIVDAFKESGVENKVKHRKIIIPELASRFSGELMELLKWEWEVIVGPEDSSGISRFLADNWPPKEKEPK